MSTNPKTVAAPVSTDKSVSKKRHLPTDTDDQSSNTLPKTTQPSPKNVQPPLKKQATKPAAPSVAPPAATTVATKGANGTHVVVTTSTAPTTSMSSVDSLPTSSTKTRTAPVAKNASKISTTPKAVDPYRVITGSMERFYKQAEWRKIFTEETLKEFELVQLKEPTSMGDPNWSYSVPNEKYSPSIRITPVQIGWMDKGQGLGSTYKDSGAHEKRQFTIFFNQGAPVSALNAEREQEEKRLAMPAAKRPAKPLTIVEVQVELWTKLVWFIRQLEELLWRHPNFRPNDKKGQRTLARKSVAKRYKHLPVDKLPEEEIEEEAKEMFMSKMSSPLKMPKEGSTYSHPAIVANRYVFKAPKKDSNGVVTPAKDTRSGTFSDPIARTIFEEMKKKGLGYNAPLLFDRSGISITDLLPDELSILGYKGGDLIATEITIKPFSQADTKDTTGASNDKSSYGHHIYFGDIQMLRQAPVYEKTRDTVTDSYAAAYDPELGGFGPPKAPAALSKVAPKAPSVNAKAVNAQTSAPSEEEEQAAREMENEFEKVETAKSASGHNNQSLNNDDHENGVDTEFHESQSNAQHPESVPQSPRLNGEHESTKDGDDSTMLSEEEENGTQDPSLIQKTAGNESHQEPSSMMPDD